MSSGIDFAGDGAMDISHNPSSTGQPEKAARGAAGPIQWTGDGGSDVGGTIADTSESGTMPPKGGDVQFAGDGAMDA